MSTAAAYFNWGRWVVDCPGCSDAREVHPGETATACFVGHQFAVDWPPGDAAARVSAELAGRDERHRSWFPTGHPLAVATGQPHGQSVADLRAETRMLEQQAGRARDKRAQVRAALDALGVEFDERTGTIRGL